VLNFEVAKGIPSQRSNPVALPHSELLKRIGKLASSPGGIAVAIAVNWAFNGSRHYFRAVVKSVRMPQQR
jgi:hypothetical protein